MRTISIKVLAGLAVWLGLQTMPVLADTMQEQAILDNIKPIGTVAVAGESASGGGAVAEVKAARSGSDVYHAVCMACHATGAAGAPKVGDKAAWGPRAEQGIDTLLHSAINGKNAMPPKGTCADCTDEELKGAIEYMLSETGLK